ncbi:MAG: PD-(D/E)XK nuclease family protein [Termitinemataceae bacterium]|nr:MAG: PD-(D/E)XK nuclease family protein [Termitinemataceae bacterium]
MNEIESAIKQHLKDKNYFFVFQSDIDAKQWLRRSCTFEGGITLASGRFMAWDKFIEINFYPHCESGAKKSISYEMRLLFVYKLIKENAALAEEKTALNGLPLTLLTPFISIIPVKYAKEGYMFAHSIASILPHLDYWQQRKNESGLPLDNEDKDLLVIKNMYTEFLKTTGFFEASYFSLAMQNQKEFTQRLKDANGNKYIIFYPELIEDFSQYENIFKSHEFFNHIETVNIKKSDEIGTLKLYETSASELRSVILQMQDLHTAHNVPYEDMALNVCGLKNLEPYIAKEFSQYGIPLHSHSGKALTDYGSGAIWNAINECVQTKWTFVSLKKLLFNNFIRWISIERNKELIDFGMRNNCVCGYYINDKYVDVWEAALFVSGKEDLHEYYVKLKTTLTNMTRAKTFAAIRKSFFDFRTHFLQPHEKNFENGQSENDQCELVLSRCIDELWELINLEKQFPALMPDNPFAFFLSMLERKQYVPRRPEIGVNVFAFPIAATSPFKYHFIINANQSDASISHKPLKFLNNEKRKSLSLEDHSAGGETFCAYKNVCTHYSVSASSHTYSGWKIPNSFWSEHLENAAVPPTAIDNFYLEKLYWANGLEFKINLYPVQKESFLKWQNIVAAEHAAHKQKEKKLHPLYLQHILDNKMPNIVKTSATDLDAFFTCRKKWLYSCVLKLWELPLNALLFDDKSRGIIFHNILEELFRRIQKDDKIFKAENMERYKDHLHDITCAVVKKQRNNILIEPFFRPLSKSIYNILSDYLEVEGKYFDSYRIELLEEEFSKLLEWDDGKVLLTGRIDRVSLDKEGKAIIIDYKTVQKKTLKSYRKDENGEIKNFQMACYVSLYEQQIQEQKKVSAGIFVSLIESGTKALKVIFNDNEPKKTTRENFEDTLLVLNESIRFYRDCVTKLNLSNEPIDFETCIECTYKHICRTTYTSGGIL